MRLLRRTAPPGQSTPFGLSSCVYQYNICLAVSTHFQTECQCGWLARGPYFEDFLEAAYEHAVLVPDIEYFAAPLAVTLVRVQPDTPNPQLQFLRVPRTINPVTWTVDQERRILNPGPWTLDPGP